MWILEVIWVILGQISAIWLLRLEIAQKCLIFRISTQFLKRIGLFDDIGPGHEIKHILLPPFEKFFQIFEK